MTWNKFCSPNCMLCDVPITYESNLQKHSKKRKNILKAQRLVSQSRHKFCRWPVEGYQPNLNILACDIFDIGKVFVWHCIWQATSTSRDEKAKVKQGYSDSSKSRKETTHWHYNLLQLEMALVLWAFGPLSLWARKSHSAQSQEKFLHGFTSYPAKQWPHHSNFHWRFDGQTPALTATVCMKSGDDRQTATQW